MNPEDGLDTGMARYKWLLSWAAIVAIFTGADGFSGAQPAVPANRDSITLATPVINAQKHEFKIPAAFWNEHLTDWLDVALCGRPSNFLHETVLSIQTTRHIMKQAFTAIGYHSATKWSPNLTDFGTIRGEPVLILVRFKTHGKEQTFLLDELIEFRAWHISIGPFGWLYLGTHDPYQVAAVGALPQGGQSVDSADILRDDPQVAMQFRGIQHASQSLLNFPLCFDNWIYPNIRYHRNSAVLPMKVFNSNGKVPATLIFRRVSEAQYLAAAIKYWHDPRMATRIQKLMPVAKTIDSTRRRLWVLVHQKHWPWTHWRVERCVAQLQYEYSRLQSAWVAWDVAHAQFRAANNLTARQVAAQAKLFSAHLRQVQAGDHQLWLATQALDKLRALGKSPPANMSAMARRLRSEELAARSRALLDSNKQDELFWGNKKRGLKPDDPRKIWIQDVMAQYALAQARKTMGECGLAYAAAMKSGHAAMAQRQYLAAILKVSLAHEKLALVNVDFHIINDQGFASAKHIQALQKEKATIQERIDHIQIQLAKLTSP